MQRQSDEYNWEIETEGDWAERARKDICLDTDFPDVLPVECLLT